MGLKDSDPENPLIPPSSDRVWKRACCLSAVVCRSFIDDGVSDPTCHSLGEKMLPWLRTTGAEGELELWEKEFLSASLGALDQSKRSEASWMSEGLATLAWAVRRYELPKHDQCVDPQELTTELGFLQDAKDLSSTHPLRPLDEIRWKAEQAFAIHWRLRNFSLNRQPMDFVSFSKTAWFGPLNIDGLTILDGDLALNRKRLRETSEDEFWRAYRTSEERHRGFNWLLGYEQSFSEVDTST